MNTRQLLRTGLCIAIITGCSAVRKRHLLRRLKHRLLLRDLWLPRSTYAAMPIMESSWACSLQLTQCVLFCFGVVALGEFSRRERLQFDAKEVFLFSQYRN